MPWLALDGLSVHCVELRLLAFSLIPFKTVPAQIYDFKSYTVREGLQSDSVTSLFEVSRGYLWIGTAGGIGVHDSGHIHLLSRINTFGSSLAL